MSISSGGMQKYNAIIVDPDLGTRMRLKQATSSVATFGNVRQSGSPYEAMAHIENDSTPCDVIFISHRFPDDEVGKFISQCKEKKTTQDSAFILVLKSAKEGGAAVANQVALGFDGFLVEPYSVNSLVEITELSARVKKERGEARAKIAVNMLVNDMIAQLDLVAFMKSCGYEVSKSWGKLKEMSTTLRTFGDSYMDVCLSTMIRLFSDAPLPKRVFQVKKYGGVSDRVKKRMEAKILSEVSKRGPSLPSNSSSSHSGDGAHNPDPKVIKKNES